MLRAFFVRATLLLPLVAACGGATTSDGDLSPQPIDPATLPPELPALFPAKSGDSIVIARIAPRELTADAVGGALPGLSAARDGVKSLRFSSDRSRILVTVRAGGTEGGTALFVLANGTWKRALVSDVEPPVVGVSADVSLAWVMSACARADEHERQKHRADVLDLATGDLTPIADCGTSTPEPGGLVTGSRKVVYADRGDTESTIRVRELGGAVRTVKTYPHAFEERTAVIAAFETSVIVQTRRDELEWIDYEGRRLDVPGFVPSLEALALGTNYQVSNGELSLLSDRKVAYLQRVPVTARPWDVQMLVPGRYALLESSAGVVDMIATDGSVSVKALESSPDAPGNHIFFGPATGAKRWIMAQAATIDPNSKWGEVTSYRESITIFHDLASASAQTLRVLDGDALTKPTMSTSRIYQPSSTGDYLMYGDTAGFWRVQVTSAERWATTSKVATTLEPLLSSPLVAPGAPVEMWLDAPR